MKNEIWPESRVIPGSKKVVSGLLTFALIIFLPSVPLFASQASAKKCTSKGATKIAQRKKFTCIKTRKGLIWDSGSLMPMKNSTLPSPAAMPQLAWEIGYERVFKQLDKSNGIAPIAPVFSPTVNKNQANAILKSFSESVSLYSKYLGKVQPIYIIFMSEDDEAFYKNQVLALEGSQGDSNFFQSTHCQPSSQNYCAYGSNKISRKIIFYEFLGSKMTIDNKSVKISNYHESVHMYQQSLTLENMYTYMPPWFIEGQATFLGNVSILNFASFSDIEKLRSSQIQGAIKSAEISKATTQEDLIKLFEQFDKDTKLVTEKSLGYNIGMLMSEFLYLNYSANDINSLILKVYETHNWGSSVKDKLGVSMESFHGQMARYVLDQLGSN